MGQTVYTTLADAQAEDPNLSILGWTNLTDEHIFFERMTYKRVGSTNTFNAQLVSVQAIRSNNINVSGVSPSDHQLLSNRSAINAHPASSISFTPSGNITSTDVSSALSELDNNKEPVITAGTSLQYYRGDKTWQTLNTSIVPEGTNLYFTFNKVLTSTLSGFTQNNTYTLINSADTMMTAFEKVDYNISYLNTNRITGTNGAANQVAYFSTSTNLISSSSYTYNNNILNVPNLNLNSTSTDMLVMANTINNAYTRIRFNGTGRSYTMGVGNSAETTYSLANRFYIFDFNSTTVRFSINSAGTLYKGTTDEILSRSSILSGFTQNSTYTQLNSGDTILSAFNKLDYDVQYLNSYKQNSALTFNSVWIGDNNNWATETTTVTEWTTGASIPGQKENKGTVCEMIVSDGSVIALPIVVHKTVVLTSTGLTQLLSDVYNNRYYVIDNITLIARGVSVTQYPTFSIGCNSAASYVDIAASQTLSTLTNGVNAITLTTNASKALVQANTNMTLNVTNNAIGAGTFEIIIRGYISGI
jgi:hypothetical protein